MSLDADDGAQDLAAARPQALVHHLHRVLAERWPMSPRDQWQRPLHGTPLSSRHPAGARTHPHSSSTFLLRGAGSSRRKGSESVSKPSSAWGELRASLEYLGLPAGWGGEGVEMSLPPLQCPLVVLLPLSETSPLSFQGSHAAREAAGRGHVLPPSTRGQPTPPTGQRPALRLDNPQQQFASIYLFFLKLGKVKPLHLFSAPDPSYWSFILFFPSLSSLASVQSHRLTGTARTRRAASTGARTFPTAPGGYFYRSGCI